MKNFRKIFFVYCAIAAGISILIVYSIELLPYIDFIGRNWLIPMICFSLPTIFGSITLLGVVKAVIDTLFFRILAILAVIFSNLFFITLFVEFMPFYEKWNLMNSTVFHNSFCLIIFYCIIVAIIGITALVKRKWLPGVCLLTVVLPWFLIFHTPDLLFPDWALVFYGILASPAWFIIAWWLKKESVSPPVAALV